MAYKYRKYRLSTTTIALSLAIMFVAGFLVAYTIINIQHEALTRPALQKITGNQVLNQIQLTKAAKASTNVAAVSTQGEGMLGEVIVEVEAGEGKILVDTTPFVEPDTQYSAVTAVEVAKAVTKTDLKDKNVIINFNINGTVLGGPSAGAAVAITTIAAIENKQVKSNVALTGTIEKDGTIGKVGGLIEKGDAAATNGNKLFLIPEGQSKFTYYQKEIVKKQLGNIVFYQTKLTPKTINLEEYFQDKGMEIVEVSNIQEAVNYML